MLNRAWLQWLSFVTAALFLALLVVNTDKADADSLPLVETPCGTSLEELRCFNIERPVFTTTFDQPDTAVTITPIFPDDAANWQLLELSAAFGSAVFVFAYPISSIPSAASMLVVATFTDFEGHVFHRASMQGEDGSCGVRTEGIYAGMRVCSDGNGLFPPSYHYPPGTPLDRNPPSLTGPITVHVDWTVLGETEVPESSSLFVDAYFGYVLQKTPIPEPSTGLLTMTGLLGLAYSKSQQRQARTGSAP